MELVKLTDIQIELLDATEQERKSNEAFAKLAAIIKYYNDGWEPCEGDFGYYMYSRRLLLWGESAMHGSDCDLGYAYSYYGFSPLNGNFGARLAIRDYDLCKFIAENYEQLYKDLWMEE